MVKRKNMMIARLRKDLNQQELADLVDSQRNYISKIENGLATPSLKLAKKIATALDSTVDELFGNGEQK